MNALIDTHTHLYTEEFDADRELAVIRAVEAGVTRLLMPNIDDTTVEAMLKLCEAHDCCYPMIGFHPTSVDAGWKERLEKVKGYLTSSSHCFYGIGEVGVDLYWDKTFREEQMIVFEEQVKWALEYDLPLIIHCRELIRNCWRFCRVTSIQPCGESSTVSRALVKMQNGCWNTNLLC